MVPKYGDCKLMRPYQHAQYESHWSIFDRTAGASIGPDLFVSAYSETDIAVGIADIIIGINIGIHDTCRESVAAPVSARPR